MKINLKRESKFKFATSSFGQLASFELSVKNISDLHDRLGKTMENVTPIEYLHALISVTCHPIDKLIENKYAPNNYSLTLNDAEKISNDECNEFARLYLNHNDHLFRKKIEKLEPNKEGKGTVFSIEYGDIEYPQDAGESIIDYIYRLTVIREKEHKKRFEGIFSSYQKAMGFSADLEKQIKSTYNMGASLKKTIDDMRTVGTVKPIYDYISKIDFTKINEDATRNRLAPFKDLSEKLDKLIELSSDSTEFIIKTNETQTKIAEEIKKSGEDTLKSANKNIKIGLFIIGFTILSLAITGLTIYLNIDSSKKQIESLEKQTNKIVGNLKNINESINKQNKQK
jgi:hypothetical protein